MVDLLGHDSAHDRAPVLERHSRMPRDRGEEALLLGDERRVAVADELADCPAAPAQRKPDRVRACTSSGQAIVPSSSTSAAPVASTAAIVVFTIASSDSYR